LEPDEHRGRRHAQDVEDRGRDRVAVLREGKLDAQVGTTSYQAITDVSNQPSRVGGPALIPHASVCTITPHPACDPQTLVPVALAARSRP
jgi:hypothetical protein